MSQNTALIELGKPKHNNIGNNNVSRCVLGDNNFKGLSYIISLIELERDWCCGRGNDPHPTTC